MSSGSERWTTLPPFFFPSLKNAHLFALYILPAVSESCLCLFINRMTSLYEPTVFVACMQWWEVNKRI